MDALHRRDDTQLTEARDVRRGEVLRVLDAPAQIPLAGICRERRSKMLSVSRFARSPIACTQSDNRWRSRAARLR
jgi:hypothetical protein